MFVRLDPSLVPLEPSVLYLCLSEHEGVTSHQGKVVGVNPNDAQLREVSVVSGNLLQDLQELKTI